MAANMIGTAAMRAEADLVALEFSGNVRDMGGAGFGLVKDVTTGKTDGTVTRAESSTFQV